MTVKLANGTILEPILVTGGGRYVQGFDRDVLTFVFPAAESMDALDAAFSEEACQSIDIDGSTYTNYIVRVELKKDNVVVTEATDTADAIREDRIFVSMGQLTHNEIVVKNAISAEELDAAYVEGVNEA